MPVEANNKGDDVIVLGRAVKDVEAALQRCSSLVFQRIREILLLLDDSVPGLLPLNPAYERVTGVITIHATAKPGMHGTLSALLTEIVEAATTTD